jgi:hypothetical protein
MKINMVYFLKYGTKTHNECFNTRVPSVIHCVYKTDDPHGSVYAAISESLFEQSDGKNVVPHMLNLPLDNPGDNFRDQLNISKDKIVFGRHGAKDTFALPGIRELIIKLLNNTELVFLFMPIPDISWNKT